MEPEGCALRILIVEDHRETRRLLKSILADAGYEPDAVGDLKSARLKLASQDYAALVLDWMLPDGGGLELCREIRAARTPLPVLVLTARADIKDRVTGLDAGADDYLPKPFAVAELLARVRALLRRGPRLQEDAVRLGRVEVRLPARRILLDGREVPVTAREFSILEVLLRRRGHAVSRSDLLEMVWGEASPGGEASLEVLIARLRRKLSPEGGEGPIRTLRGFGYLVE